MMITRRRIILSILVVLGLLLTVLSAIAQEGRIVRETIYSPSVAWIPLRIKAGATPPWISSSV